MPVYVFECAACRSRSELFVRSINASFQRICPSCRSANVTPVFTPFSVLRSAADKVDSLDPRYTRMVDDAYARGGR